MKNNRKGIAPIFLVLVILLVLVAFYLVLWIPIPAFTKIRSVINYVLLLILFVAVQILIILGYYYTGKYIVKGVQLYKRKFQGLFLKIENYLILHGR